VFRSQCKVRGGRLGDEVTSQTQAILQSTVLLTERTTVERWGSQIKGKTEKRFENFFQTKFSFFSFFSISKVKYVPVQLLNAQLSSQGNFVFLRMSLYNFSMYTDVVLV